ncbi:unnamed protein product [marine sediment metagenome]|uniref:YokE-like PH domain-containing protein n=1 Tax=marine sediment metagenome TaxID=412755 RepID=X1EFE3_9ZZZZ
MSGVYLSKIWNKNKEYGKLFSDAQKNHFAPDEIPIACLTGNKDDTMKFYIMILTNRRVILFGRLFGEEFEAYPYEKITNVESYKGLILGRITINATGTSVKYNNMQLEDVDYAAQIIREKIEESRNKEKVEVVNDDPLKILKVRYAKGEISKEEYEDIKKDLI